MDKITMALCCRVCLELEELMVHIYDEVMEDLQSDLSTLLEQCGGIKVERDDDFPKFLCKECTSELLIAAKFREKCERTQQILATMQWSEEDAALTLISDEQEVAENVLLDVTDSALETNSLLLSEEGDVDVVALNLDDNDNGSVVESIRLPADQQAINECEYADDMEENEMTEDALTFFGANVEPAATTNEIAIKDDYDDDDKNMEQQSFCQVQTVDQKLQLVCDVCGASFRQTTNLQRHMEKVHQLTELYSCGNCDQRFGTESHYKDHRNSCGDAKSTAETASSSKENQPNANTKVPECSYCGKRLQSTFALNMHLRTHTGERPYACEQCPKAFKSQAALSTHLKRHAGLPDFACTVCNKTFYESSNLTAHMRIHTGEKPHVCSVCKKRFSRVFLLQLHMRTHTGERPYRCGQCDRAFAQQCDLRNHMRTHTGERRYHCPICAKTFIRRYPLVLHMERHVLMDETVTGSGSKSNSGSEDQQELGVDAQWPIKLEDSWNAAVEAVNFSATDTGAVVICSTVGDATSAENVSNAEEFNWDDLIVEEEVV